MHHTALLTATCSFGTFLLVCGFDAVVTLEAEEQVGRVKLNSKFFQTHETQLVFGAIFFILARRSDSPPVIPPTMEATPDGPVPRSTPSALIFDWLLSRCFSSIFSDSN